jgi:hypothetical protein
MAQGAYPAETMMSAHWTEAVRLIDVAEEIATSPELSRPEFMSVMRDTLHRLSAYVCRDDEQRSIEVLMRACGQLEVQGRTAWPVFSEAWSAFWQVWSYSREIALFLTDTLQSSPPRPSKKGSAEELSRQRLCHPRAAA